MTPKKQENTNKSATLHILIREGIYIYNHNPLEKKVENTNKSAMLHVHIH